MLLTNIATAERLITASIQADEYRNRNAASKGALYLAPAGNDGRNGHPALTGKPDPYVRIGERKSKKVIN